MNENKGKKDEKRKDYSSKETMVGSELCKEESEIVYTTRVLKNVLSSLFSLHVVCVCVLFYQRWPSVCQPCHILSLYEKERNHSTEAVLFGLGLRGLKTQTTSVCLEAKEGTEG